MLLMNKKGRIYDVPDEISEQYLATSWNASKGSITEFLSSSIDSPAPEPDEVECGCCCVYANYCPNK